jgi:hypothetical protein
MVAGDGEMEHEDEEHRASFIVSDWKGRTWLEIWPLW